MNVRSHCSCPNLLEQRHYKPGLSNSVASGLSIVGCSFAINSSKDKPTPDSRLQQGLPCGPFEHCRAGKTCMFSRLPDMMFLRRTWTPTRSQRCPTSSTTTNNLGRTKIMLEIFIAFPLIRSSCSPCFQPHLLHELSDTNSFPITSTNQSCRKTTLQPNFSTGQRNATLPGSETTFAL